MNNIFSIKRFALLVRKLWLENYLLYLGSFIILVAFDFFVLYQSNTWSHEYHPAHFDITSVIIISLGTYAAFSLLAYFRTINTHTKQLAYYTQPTSTLEKLISAFLFLVPVMLIVFAAALLITIPIIHSMYDSFYHTTSTILSTYDTKTIKESILIFLTLQSLILLGMHTFKRYAIVKTSIAIIILFIFFFYALPELTFNYIFPIEGFRDCSYDTISYIKNQVYDKICYQGIPYFPGYLVYICWFALYFKIKEKQL